MTKPEVLALTDEELRIKAALLAGWENIAPHVTSGIPYGKKPDGYAGFDAEERWDYIPDYPNDIAAAWELVEKLKHPGHVWYATVSLVDHTTNYLCSVIYENAEGGIFQVSDKSAPRAITRAFIMAMESSYA